jgi:hypothetical protein
MNGVGRDWTGVEEKVGQCARIGAVNGVGRDWTGVAAKGGLCATR